MCQRLVFFPPIPFYHIEERRVAAGSAAASSSSSSSAPRASQTLWLVEDGKKIEPYTSPNLHMSFVATRKKSVICCMWIRSPGATTSVVFSHGNATDLGCMRDHLIDFAKQLKVNVLAYDYTGYGLSAHRGGPSMSHTLADAEAAYDYLVRTYPAESQRILVYGQSIGSGPTIHLASHRKVNGVVIHAGIMSCLRVIAPETKATRWFDIFPNIDLVSRLQASLFIMHGTADKEIPVIHGQSLAAAAPRAFPPWFVEGAGHNNIEVDFREAFFAHLDGFVRYIEQTTGHVDECEDPLAAAAQEGEQKRLVAPPPAAAASASSSSARAASPQRLHNKQPVRHADPVLTDIEMSPPRRMIANSPDDPRLTQSPKQSPTRGKQQPQPFDGI